MMRPMQTEADWKQIAKEAESREIAMFALGVTAGLRWAKDQAMAKECTCQKDWGKYEPTCSDYENCTRRWQPIETAPKDGTPFLAAVVDTVDEYDEDDRRSTTGNENGKLVLRRRLAVLPDRNGHQHGWPMTIAFTRVFAMPNAETFSIKPIGEFVQKYLAASKVSVDPFARNRSWATYTNDINPKTSAQSHQDAEAFLKGLTVRADLALFDPPYSPRQVSEHYKDAGLTVTREDTQNGRLYKRVRDALDRLMLPGGVVLSFGWQSAGMGIGRGYELIETMLVAHGGGHNDTICIAERKRQ